MTSTLVEISYRMAAQHARINDMHLRRLLGQWVSEFEPTAYYDRDGNLIGLGANENPAAGVVLGVLNWKPLLQEIMKRCGIDGALPMIVTRDLGYD